jgi:hypothetical protein
MPNVRSWSRVAQSRLFVVVCFLTIASVAAFDTWSAAANSEIITVEKNPICVFLLDLDPEGRSYFVMAKILGAATTLFVLGLLLKVGYPHGYLVTGAITAFQIGLMIYLCFSDPRLYGLPNFFFFYDSAESIFVLS